MIVLQVAQYVLVTATFFFVILFAVSTAKAFNLSQKPHRTWRLQARATILLATAAFMVTVILGLANL